MMTKGPRASSFGSSSSVSELKWAALHRVMRQKNESQRDGGSVLGKGGSNK